MTAIKIGSKTFSGLSKVHDGTLADAIRGIAIDLARTKVATASVPDLTDNSTGVAAASIVDQVIPSVAFDATSAGGADRAATNTAFGKIENAGKVLVNSFNNVRVRIGLPVMSAFGTAAAADTIPAQDLTVTTASGTSAIDFNTGRASMLSAKKNIGSLVQGFNEIMAALGETKVASAMLGDLPFGALVDIATADAAATGASSIAKTVMDAFLTASAANIATLAALWNGVFIQTGLSDLTDSSGGSASDTLAAITIPAAADGAATTSSPKAGFDTNIAVIENNLSELVTRMNVLRKHYGLAAYTDSTGQSVNGTLESQSVNLTAVDGSSGTVAVDQVSGRAALTVIKNAITSLGTGINELADYFGLTHLTISTGGVASTTIANVAATGTGVAGAGATLLDTDVDAVLAIIRDSNSSLAAKLNAMTGTGSPDKPLSVVAA